MLLQSIEYPFQHTEMIISRLGFDQNVINIVLHVDMQHIVEYCGHCPWRRRCLKKKGMTLLTIRAPLRYETKFDFDLLPLALPYRYGWEPDLKPYT